MIDRPIHLVEPDAPRRGRDMVLARCGALVGKLHGENADVTCLRCLELQADDDRGLSGLQQPESDPRRI